MASSTRVYSWIYIATGVSTTFCITSFTLPPGLRRSRFMSVEGERFIGHPTSGYFLLDCSGAAVLHAARIPTPINLKTSCHLGLGDARSNTFSYFILFVLSFWSFCKKQPYYKTHLCIYVQDEWSRTKSIFCSHYSTKEKWWFRRDCELYCSVCHCTQQNVLTEEEEISPICFRTVKKQLKTA